MVINKSCIINICKNKTEQRLFFFFDDLLQRAEIGFLRSSESQTVSSRSAVVRSRCVPPNSKFLFFKALVNVTYLYKSMSVLQTCDSVIAPGLFATKRIMNGTKIHLEKYFEGLWCTGNTVNKVKSRLHSDNNWRQTGASDDAVAVF